MHLYISSKRQIGLVLINNPNNLQFVVVNPANCKGFAARPEPYGAAETGLFVYSFISLNKYECPDELQGE